MYGGISKFCQSLETLKYVLFSIHDVITTKLPSAPCFVNWSKLANFASVES